MHAMQVVGARAAMLNKFMVEYLNESFHLSTHLSALARVFLFAVSSCCQKLCAPCKSSFLLQCLAFHGL